ncbi:hypothetical protein [Zunongwangia pacifica]|uniref:YD repeat-containing protein n=1 Tax=Zunongwangia pacifica TaxID=2911062 RepID=A0A9X1ZUD0_9FLAO|nr:hypothetical protein [Zunongwangia pacifica]MCL6220281.1 hypothetical protein [Zunongwangia pacifica]
MPSILTKIRLTIILLLIIFESQAQDDIFLSSNDHLLANEIIAPSVHSPEVSSFIQSSILPVNTFVGKVDVSIPIYKISLGSLNVPISLNYVMGGVKVAEMAPNYGLSWSLKGSGALVRSVKDLSDYAAAYKRTQSSNYLTPGGWLYNINPNSEFGSATLNPSNDALPDIFKIDAPGISTEFYLTPNGTPVELHAQRNKIIVNLGTNPKIYYTENGTEKVTTSMWGITSLTITNLSGIQYTFDLPEYTYSDLSVAKLEDVINGFQINSFRLSEIKDLKTGQKISYTYDEYFSSYYDQIPEIIKSYGGGAYSKGSNGNYNTIYRGNKLISTHRLTKIEFNGGEVDFIYKTVRLDNPGEKQLNEIQIKDNFGDLVKKYELKYGYFESSINSSSVASKRLKLKEISEVDENGVSKPGYAFLYNEDYTMPPRDSYAYDFLGYNNGSYSSSISNPVPKLYYKDYLIAPFNSTSSISLQGNFSLLSNLNYAKTYSLKEIVLPTGGSRKFEYELNQFNHNGQIINGGGLRIKSQTLESAESPNQTWDYSYPIGKIGNMPQYAAYYVRTNSFSTPSNLTSLSNQLGIDIFSTPRTEIQYNQGSFVYYSHATETNIGGNNGKREVSYYVNDDEDPLKTYSSNHISVSTLWDNLTQSRIRIDNDFLRGMIKTDVSYNSSNKIIRHQRFIYEEDIIDYLPMEYYNVVHNSCSSNSYSSEGLAKFNWCGGYKETADYPISRFLLKTHRVTEYDIDGELSSVQDETDGIFTEKNLYYDSYYPLITSEVISNFDLDYNSQNLSESNTISWYSQKNIKYPVKFDGARIVVNDFPYAQQLFDQNRVSTPMEIKITGRSYTKETFEYADFGNGLIDLKKVDLELRDNETVPTVEIISRNVKGLPTEILKPNGAYTSIVYGYSDEQVIAMVEGARLNTINSWLNQSYGQTLSYLSQLADNDGDKNAEEALSNWLQKLRLAVNSNAESSVQVRTYTYDPLKGVTRIIDPNGNISYYKRDALNRLQEMKNDDGHILEFYNYNYKNQ